MITLVVIFLIKMNIQKSETVTISLTEGEIREAILDMLRAKQTSENASYFKGLSVNHITFKTDGMCVISPNF